MSSIDRRFAFFNFFPVTVSSEEECHTTTILLHLKIGTRYFIKKTLFIFLYVAKNFLKNSSSVYSCIILVFIVTK